MGKRIDRQRLADISKRQMAEHTGQPHPGTSEELRLAGTLGNLRLRSREQYEQTRRLLEARGAKQIQHDTAAIGGERDQKAEGGHGD